MMKRLCLNIATSLPIVMILGVAAMAVPPLSLSLSDSVELAIKNNPEVQSVRLTITAKENAVLKNVAFWYPKLSAHANAFVSSEGTDQLRDSADLAIGTLRVVQKVWDNGVISNKIKIARRQLNMSKVDLESVKMKVSTQVSEHFFELMVLQKEIEFQEGDIQRRGKELTRLKSNFKSRISDDIPFQSKALEYESAKLRLSEKEREYVKKKEDLNTLLGFSNGQDWTLKEISQDDPLNYERPDSNWIESHPDIKRIKQARELRQMQVKAVASRDNITADLLGEYRFLVDRTSEVRGGVAITWPIFDGGQTWFAVKESKALTKASDSDLKNATLQLRQTFDDLWFQYQQSKNYYKLAQKQEALSKKIYNNSRSQFAQGILSENELEKNRLAYQEAQLSRFRFYAQSRRAEMMLKLLAGADPQ